MRAIRLLVLAFLVCLVSADVYMHFPRGSNNRFRTDQNTVTNENRLCDTQNDNNGGYRWGPSMTFYSGSLLQIEWTAQHGCGVDHPNVDCNMVIQYMCGPWVTDGEDGETIDPDDPNPTSGHHEPQEYYKDCKARQRNLGLFLANRAISKNADATRTRQNPGGERFGTECPEEKDYYPYWHPTPWRDIAVLTSHPSRCGYYKKNSQNVVPKHHCVRSDSELVFDPDDASTYRNVYGRYPTENLLPGNLVPNNKIECEELGHKWEEVPAWGIGAPECLATFYARDNHLGNSYIYGKLMTNVYKWKVPNTPVNDKDAPDELKYSNCVVRLRYNISTTDWDMFGEVDGKTMVDASYNEEFIKNYGANRNDPIVPYGVDPTTGLDRNLTLNVDFTQFGRTFQDRSHVMHIRKRPSSIPPSSQIFNLNVRGRRGNIVEAYPAVEHDFVPLHLKVKKGDYIHIQWTGNDEGPDVTGNGKKRTERHNIVMLKDNDGRKNWPEDINKQKLFDYDIAYLLAHLDQPEYCETKDDENCCLTLDQLREKHNNNQNDIEDDDQNCFHLNAASPYFSLLTKVKKTGTFYFMSTRNNDFTNRSHKGIIESTLKLSPVAIAGVAIGGAAFIGAAVIGFAVWYTNNNPDNAPDFFRKIKI